VRASLKATPKDTAPATALSIEIGDDDDLEEAVSDNASFKDALSAVDRQKPEISDTVAARTVPAATIEKMQDELSSLRGLLETQLAGLVWRDSSERYPQRAQVLRNLAKLGIAPDIAEMVINRMPPIEDDEVWKTPLVTLAQAIPVGPSDLIRDGGIAALIGPTGVGKTTTIAKIASRYAMEHGTEDIALVSADSYRIGAREHLKAFANIIGVRVYSAADSDELTELLIRLGKKKLVLIDTEGRSQRDRDLAARLAAYGSHADRVHFYLTLSATTQEAGLDEAVRTFSEVPLSGCIVTKIDEAAQLGCMISTAIRHDLPLTWLTDGQRIPDDLHAAKRKRLWLVNQALDCMRASNPTVDERFMAEHFAQASAAHG
jgi:flagellar biosynthesis protein FlhF